MASIEIVGKGKNGERTTWTPIGTPPDYKLGRATKEQVGRVNEAIELQAQKKGKRN